MSTFTIHTPETAPEASRSILAGAKLKYGFIPNLLGVLAEAPAALEAYVKVSDLLAKSSFTATEREVILIATSIRNLCEYCVAAHATIAKMQKVPVEVIVALREGRPLADPRLEALRQFTQTLIEKRGWATEKEVRDFLAAGFNRQQVLEVVLGLAFKTISNYTNHIVDTPVDEAFSAEALGARKAS